MNRVADAVQQNAPQLKHAADGILAAAAMSLPAWVDNITTVVGLITAMLGIVLLGIRVYLGIIEIKQKRREMDE